MHLCFSLIATVMYSSFLFVLILLLDPGGTRSLNLLISSINFQSQTPYPLGQWVINNVSFGLILLVIYGEKSKANTDLTVRIDFMDSAVVNQGLWRNG